MLAASVYFLYVHTSCSYFCTIITTWTFLLVPFVSLMFDIQPVKFGHQFALAASLYLFANFTVSLEGEIMGSGGSSLRVETTVGCD